MIDRREPDEREMEDIQLLTEFLNHQLDAERVALVEQRLREDAAFREWAAPLVLAWSVPADWGREPLPPGELEKQWDRFTKSAGFIHQKRKARRRLLIVVAALAVAAATTLFFARHRIQAAWEDARDYEPVQAINGEARLPNDAVLTLAPGSSLRIQVRGGRNDVTRVRLHGDAHVLVLRPPAKGLMPVFRPLIIDAGPASVSTANAELTVATRGDTTVVNVLHRRRLDAPTDLFDQLPDIVVVTSAAYPLRLVQLREGDRALVVGDEPVQKITAANTQP
jgi:hypothetical protein